MKSAQPNLVVVKDEEESEKELVTLMTPVSAFMKRIGGNVIICSADTPDGTVVATVIKVGSDVQKAALLEEMSNHLKCFKTAMDNVFDMRSILPTGPNMPALIAALRERMRNAVTPSGAPLIKPSMVPGVDAIDVTGSGMSAEEIQAFIANQAEAVAREAAGQPVPAESSAEAWDRARTSVPKTLVLPPHIERILREQLALQSGLKPEEVDLTTPAAQGAIAMLDGLSKVLPFPPPPGDDAQKGDGA